MFWFNIFFLKVVNNNAIKINSFKCVFQTKALELLKYIEDFFPVSIIGYYFMNKWLFESVHNNNPEGVNQ